MTEGFNVPDGMPVLSGGHHADPSQGACVMEYVSILAGEPFSDSPSCTCETLRIVAIETNDMLAQQHRHRLIPFIGRLLNTPLPEGWWEVVRLHSAITATLASWRYEHAPNPVMSPWVADADGKQADWLLARLDAAINAYDTFMVRTEHKELTEGELLALAAATR